MNLLTKFHEDRTINVASRVKNAPTLGSHVSQENIIIFKLIQDIIETNVLTKFHEDWTINVASRVLTRKNVPPLFHDDRKINVTSRVLTRKNAPSPWWPYIIGMNLLTEKNAPPLGSHVFQANVIIFKLIQDINKTNLLTIFHEDWTINVASRVLTSLIWKNAPPPGGHVFKESKTIFEPIQDIIGINLLTKFHKDRKINVASRKKCPTPGGHVYQPTVIIFKLVQDIKCIGMNLLTNLHEDWTINVASRVLTRLYYSHIRKNAPPFGSHVFQANVTIFELIQDINETNLLTKFYEDWTINVACRVLTAAQRTTDKRRSQKLTMRTL
ncbi:hypothetical protein DPMN_047882 [Dreissena polymorpha]|uniref:Uncharacterized protein n=1 Tax=Dreissena polymorpha TaxID=45954 RepID=A0A9D4DAJ4_DREPO|nr:hypothetical protein DPMN_047882 [Dreissena polymorpha]